MARGINESEYAGRRNEILDAAQRLVYTKGFRPMTIQDILDELHISKGAFYHYFDSKQDLLEALIGRMLEAIEDLVVPIVRDPELGALEKLERFFRAISGWKIDRKTFLLALFQSWYSEDNAVVRHKVEAESIEAMGPLLTEIIREGIQTGVLNSPYPEYAARLFFTLAIGMGDSLGMALLSAEPEAYDPRSVETIVAAYTDAIEHVLGAPAGSMNLFYMDALNEWMMSVGEQHTTL